MRGGFLYLIPLMALTELWLIIQVGGRLGVGVTIAIVLATGLLGVTLLRRQGFKLIGQVQERLRSGEIPALEVFEGVALLIGGVLLLTPGFLTDAMGLLLLLPPLRRTLLRRFQDRIAILAGGIATPVTVDGVEVEVRGREPRDGGRESRDWGRETRDDGWAGNRPVHKPAPSGQVIEGEWDRDSAPDANPQPEKK